MVIFKIITTVAIMFMMSMFLAIWTATSDEKQYTWVWIVLEVVYIMCLVSIWGN